MEIRVRNGRKDKGIEKEETEERKEETRQREQKQSRWERGRGKEGRKEGRKRINGGKKDDMWETDETEGLGLIYFLPVTKITSLL